MKPEEPDWYRIFAPTGQDNEPFPSRTREDIRSLLWRRRVPLTKIVAEMLGSEIKTVPDAQLVIANIQHQTVQTAVAGSAIYYQVPKSTLRGIFESTKKIDLNLIENALRAAAQPPDRDGIPFNLEILASLTPAAVKYEQERGKIGKKKTNQGTQTFMFSLEQILPPIPDYKSIAKECRPAIIALINDSKIMSSGLKIETKYLFPTRLDRARRSAITIVHIFDFFAGPQVVRDLKTYDPNKIEKWKIAVQTYAIAWAEAVARKRSVRALDLWGEDPSNRILLHIAREVSLNDLQLRPADKQRIIVCINGAHPSGEPIEVEFDAQALQALSQGFRKAVEKLIK